MLNNDICLDDMQMCLESNFGSYIENDTVKLMEAFDYYDVRELRLIANNLKNRIIGYGKILYQEDRTLINDILNKLENDAERFMFGIVKLEMNKKSFSNVDEYINYFKKMIENLEQLFEQYYFVADLKEIVDFLILRKFKVAVYIADLKFKNNEEIKMETLFENKIRKIFHDCLESFTEVLEEWKNSRKENLEDCVRFYINHSLSIYERFILSYLLELVYLNELENFTEKLIINDKTEINYIAFVKAIRRFI